MDDGAYVSIPGERVKDGLGLLRADVPGFPGIYWADVREKGDEMRMFGLGSGFMD